MIHFEKPSEFVREVETFADQLKDERARKKRADFPNALR